MRLDGRRILNRLVQTAFVIVLATFGVFMLLQLVPGDPALALAGENASEARIAEIRALYAMDEPVLSRYGDWLWRAMHGDLSTSVMSGEPVMDAILRRFPNTLLIAASAFVLSIVVGIPLGIAAALRQGTPLDTGITTVASLGVAIPNFWLGMVLVALFALKWQWFPATGSVPLHRDVGLALWHVTLPAIALATGGIAEITRQVRSALIEVMSSQHVRTLHAKGLGMASIMWKHGLKNVSASLLTILGLLFTRLLGTTVVIEAVFAIPGIGQLIVDSAISKDLPVIQGVVLVMVIIVIATNFIVDLLGALLDPRVAPR